MVKKKYDKDDIVEDSVPGVRRPDVSHSCMPFIDESNKGIGNFEIVVIQNVFDKKNNNMDDTTNHYINTYNGTGSLEKVS